MSFLRNRSRNCPICGVSLRQAFDAEKSRGVPSQAVALETYLTHCQNVHPDFLAWEKSKTRLGIIFGIVTAGLAGVSTFYLALFVFHLPSTAGRTLALIPFGSFFVPLVVLTWLGTRRFRLEWKERGGSIMPPTIQLPVVNREKSFVNEDGEILVVISDLSGQLGVPSPSQIDVRWQSTIPRGRGFQIVAPDQCFFQGDQAYFAENMKGRLDPEEWRPIIAFSLIYYRKLRGTMARGGLLRILALVIPYSVSWFLIPPLFPTTTNIYNGQTAVNNNGWIILIFVGLALAFLAIPILSFYFNKMKTVADRQVAELVGTGPFIETLTKISQASPADSARINRRIENLNPSK